MAHGGGARRRGRSRRPVLRVLVVVVLFAGGLAAAGLGFARSRSHHPKPTIAAAPSTAAPAPSVSPHVAPSPVTPSPAASPTPTAATVPALWQQTPQPLAPFLLPVTDLQPGASATGIAGAVTAPLGVPALAAEHVAVVVADAASSPLFTRLASDAVLPASTAKLAVAAAALRVLGPDRQLLTRVVENADDPDDVILVGGGDPTLAGPAAVGVADPGFPAPARLAELASATAAALVSKGIDHVELGYDDSLFSGPQSAPGWKPTYFAEGDVAPVSALEVDEGEPDLTKEARAADPAALAAADFASLLTADGVTVSAAAAPVRAATDDIQLAGVLSPPVSALVERMLERSDNDLAEALARQVAIVSGLPATFSGGAQAVKAALVAAGADPAGMAMVDGSGLSPDDRLEASNLAALVRLAVAPGHPELAPILAGLPVAAFSGTLGNRFSGQPGAGTVRAKTGTLDGVVALAGYLDDASGHVLVFVLVANGVALNATATTEVALDHVVSALAGCGCS